jgi:hypothetical protein
MVQIKQGYISIFQNRGWKPLPHIHHVPVEAASSREIPILILGTLGILDHFRHLKKL